MSDPVSDTNEKILMKDHDVLIALYTQTGELIRRVDLLSTQLLESQTNTFKEFKEVAVSQAKMEGSVEALQHQLEDANNRMDKMDARWKIGDIIIAVGTIV